MTGAIAVTLLPLPAWAAMWVLAFAIFFACKWLTWARGAPRPAWESARGPGRSAALAYFLAWPGMDPGAFLRRDAETRRELRDVFRAAARVLLGAALVWIVVPQAQPARPLVAGWLGMAGIVLMLHFGVFDVLHAAWRTRGVAAKPLMNAPTRATGLADFWGNRWNTAFNDLARRYVFTPVRRLLGVAGATLATFLASGVVHDVVISVPAGGGYGLPTLYFVIQGLGVLLERTRLARRAGLGRGLPGRAFAALIVLGPLPWLFHEPFVTRVILPFLEVIR